MSEELKGLTRGQHATAVHHLQRFTYNGPMVMLFEKEGRHPPHPAHVEKHKCFKITDGWTQILETVFMKRMIEDQFAEEMDHILRGGAIRNHLAISNYYALRNVRARYMTSGVADVELVNVYGDQMALDERVSREEHGGEITFRPATSTSAPPRAMISRRAIGHQVILDEWFALRRSLKDVAWRALRLENAPLVLPDRTVLRLLPISPDTVLASVDMPAHVRVWVPGLLARDAVCWIAAQTKGAIEASLKMASELEKLYGFSKTS